MIAVMGASGNTDSRISESLLANGEQVRALGRSPDKLARLKNKGAEVLTGDATDAAFLTKAFRGADAVYTLFPPDPQSLDYRKNQDQEGESIVQAIRDGGVRYVVFLSSIGGDVPEGGTPAPAPRHRRAHPPRAAGPAQSDDFSATLVQMGMSQNIAGLYVEMTRAFNQSKVKSREGRRPENRTPTRFEDFAEELARAYQTA
jgi:nucleoside-diphosphate-sugar epimerase